MEQPRKGKSASLPLSAIARFSYALPAAPLAALGLPLYAIVPTYYTATLGLPLAGVGFAMLLVRIFDAIADPLVGIFADRIRPRMGRRRFLFACSLPVGAIATTMLYAPPADATILWLGLWGMALSFGLTLATVPYMAWGAELVGNYQERTSIAALREALTLAGILIAIIIPFSIGIDARSGISGLAVLGIVVAVALPLSGLFAVFTVREPVQHTSMTLSLGIGLGFMVRNRPFVRLLAAYFLNGFANGIPATLFLYFVSDRLALPNAGGPLLFGYFLCGVAGIPIASLAARKVGKHRAWCLAMLIACAAFVTTPLLAVGALVPFAIICAITGLMLAFDLVLPPAIQADVIDNDTAVSGDQRSGIYFAAWGFATKLSLAAGVGFVFPFLSLFDFQPAAGPQNSAEALFVLAVVYSWIPIALKLAAIALMWNFPLDQAASEDLRRRIDGL